MDYIKKAVELADGWALTSADDNFCIPPSWCFNIGLREMTQQHLDALAAQLVRQVDALADNRVKGFYSRPLQADVYWPGLGHNQCGYAITCGDDRTMNTIKAIVDSGVLA